MKSRKKKPTTTLQKVLQQRNARQGTGQPRPSRTSHGSFPPLLLAQGLWLLAEAQQGAWLGHRRARNHFALPPSLSAALSPAGLHGKQARGNVAAALFPAALAVAGSEGWQ